MFIGRDPVAQQCNAVPDTSYMLKVRLFNPDSMFTKHRRYWLVLPIVASIATQCDESPRGAIPTRITAIELQLATQPAANPPASQQVAFDVCLARMGFDTNVVPSWRNGDVIVLDQPGPNLFTKLFYDVPTGLANTMSVRDRNECRRNPNGDGTVITGVSVNGTPVEQVIPNTRVLTFLVDDNGVVSSPPLDTQAFQ